MAVATQKYTKEEIAKIYNLPIPELIFKAQEIHRQHHNANEMQLCTLSNIKTGACPEDCNYCSQSAHHNTELEVEPLMDENSILTEAVAAKENGSTRFCMGAAWRSAPNNEQFDQVLRIVSKVKGMGMEPCVTLGMLKGDQAQKLKEAGLHSYNHNLDTSEEYYGEIITTRTYQDRLDTIALVQDAGLSVCCGGILGMGEEKEDRIGLLWQIANLDPQPKSVPINMLMPVKGTPLYDKLEKEGKLDEPIEKFDLVRAIATARILVPKASIRLAAGRLDMTEELQAMCFIAGANSIFSGEKLLTEPNPGPSQDDHLMKKLGMNIKKI